jgi:hypothetical protein
MNTTDKIKELKELEERMAALRQEIEKEEAAKAVKVPTWEDAVEGKDGWWLGGFSYINKHQNFTPSEHNKNCFPHEQFPKSMLSLAQLTFLRDYYRNGWEPEVGKDVFFVRRFGGDLCYTFYKFCGDDTDLFSFQDKETAQRFLNEQRELLEEYYKMFSV